MKSKNKYSFFIKLITSIILSLPIVYLINDHYKKFNVELEVLKDWSKYKRNIDDIKRLSELQFNILTNASNYLKIDGELVYSTCTLSFLENEYVIEKFLSENKNFILQPFNLFNQENKDMYDALEDYQINGNYLTLKNNIQDLIYS